ncbi:MAG: ABC transporter ATP-binding protein [Microcystaceae cyanobacterium]
MSDRILEVRNLKVEFLSSSKADPIQAIKGIDFDLNRGEILGLVGESGSGKSVTSLAIMGLVTAPGRVNPTSEINFYCNLKSGQDFVNLVALNDSEKRQYRGGKIAMIFQEPMSSLNPVYTIGFQIVEAILLHQSITPEQAKKQGLTPEQAKKKSITPEQAKNQAIALLQEVKVLPSDEQLEEEFLAQDDNQKSEKPRTERIKLYQKQRKETFFKRYPHELSGGQLQRVMIAMAVSCNPVLLIADEPTTALDVTVQAEILRLLRDLCKNKDNNRDMAMIFISHDLGVINEIADHIAVMYQGEIVEDGDKEQVLFNPQNPYTKGLLACRPRLQPQLARLPIVADFMQGEAEPKSYRIISPESEQERLTALLEQKQPLLSVQNLTVEFARSGFLGKEKGFKALDNVSFDVYQGETLGLVGESGCGKSTLARTILRLIPSQSGRIIFDGQLLTELESGQRKMRSLRREMQIVFQNPYNSLNPRLSIGKAILEPLIIHKIGGKEKQQKQKVLELLEEVGLNPAWFNRYPHELSGGQRQRVCIARALALNPRFIICDESVSSLDVSVQAQVLNLLKELQDKLNLTYIFISHDLSVVRFMSDRIMVMNKGKLAEKIDAANVIIDNPKSDYTKKLIQAIPHFPDGTNVGIKTKPLVE